MSPECWMCPQNSNFVLRKVKFNKVEPLKASEKQLVQIKVIEENIEWN